MKKEIPQVPFTISDMTIVTSWQSPKRYLKKDVTADSKYKSVTIIINGIWTKDYKIFILTE